MARVMMGYTATLAGVPEDSLGITVKHVSFRVEYIWDCFIVPKENSMFGRARAVKTSQSEGLQNILLPEGYSE